jgi:hypothetical protein
MAYGLIGLYGIYLIFVGYKGNQNELFQALSTDGPGFVPWLISVVVLGTMYRSDTLRPVVKPFIALAILAFVLRNWNTLKSQTQSVLGVIQTNASNAQAGSTVTATPTTNSATQTAQATAGVLNLMQGNPFIGGE